MYLFLVKKIPNVFKYFESTSNFGKSTRNDFICQNSAPVGNILLEVNISLQTYHYVAISNWKNKIRIPDFYK